MTLEPETDPQVADLLREGRPRARLPLTGAERRGELIAGAVFLAAAIPIAGMDADRALHWGPALALVAAFVLASRVQLDVGSGYTVPTQLVFVPMLLLLPTPLVPLLVLAAWIVDKLIDVARGTVHPERIVLAAGNSWFALGPAVILTALDAQMPALRHWPLYLLALAAQLACDLASAEVRERLGRGVSPLLQLRLVRWVYLIDLMLSPVGLLAALAAAHTSVYALFLLAPALGTFSLFAREREHRLADAISLGEREREAADLTRRLLQSERERTRERELILAGASAEALRPLSALSGLLARLRATGPDDPARREAVEAAMLRELAQLRHLVGEFLDYARLKSGRPLVIEPRQTELLPILHQAARVFPAESKVVVEAPADVPDVYADPGRVLQIVLSLVSNAVKFSPAHAQVTITAAAAGGDVEISVSDRGKGISADDAATIFDELARGENVGDAAGVGLGLYLCRVLAEAQDGSIAVESRPGSGSRFTVRLPEATVALAATKRPLRRLRPLH